MAGVNEVLAKANKAHGGKFAHKASVMIDFDRIPFGIFPLDLATGGGIPEGKISMIYGPESSNKTNAMLKLIRSYQQLYPGRECVLVEPEHALDPNWARRLGVDLDRLHVVKPDFAEQAVDVLEGLVHAEDVGLICLDSVAAMVPNNEIEKDASTAAVGGNSAIIGKMCRKLASGLSVAAKQDRYPTILLVNQLRFKVGQMMGNPETYPGGMALKHYCNMILRFYGKNEIIKSVNPDLPCIKKTSVILKKWKVPVTAATCEFSMVTIPHDDMEVGTVQDWNTVSNYAKDQGMLGKGDKKGWIFLGEEYPTLVAVKEALEQNPIFGIKIRQQIIERAVRTINGIAPGGIEKTVAPIGTGGVVWKKKGEPADAEVEQ